MISKVIDIELNDFSRVQVKPDEDSFVLTGQVDLFNESDRVEIELSQKESFKDEDETKEDLISDAKKNGTKLYDGSICPNCSSERMVQNGTCKVCLDCGSTTGCS